VRVARCADVLAQAHGLDAGKARLAGLLHDLARLYSGPRLIEECEQRGVAIGDFERRNPIVLHAPLGAVLARDEFGVSDREVHSAIAKHTLADASMTALDTVVYLADALEPGRDYEGRRELWQLAMHDLRRAMIGTISSSLAHLADQGREPAPQTLAALYALEHERDTQGVLSSQN